MTTLNSSVGRRLLACILASWLATPPVEAADLTAGMVDSWNGYVRLTESRIAAELASKDRFLAADFATDIDADDRRDLRNGSVVLRSRETKSGDGREVEVEDAKIHHWVGLVFVPGVTIEQVRAWFRTPERHKFPDVLATRVLHRDGDAMRVFLKITRSHGITVTYDTEHVVKLREHGPGRLSSTSVAEKIAELADAGTPDERAKPAGEDHGFLWRLNSYWRYAAVEDGVIVECESLTLSRGVPALVSPLVSPLVDRVARESLTRTLTAVRTDLTRR